MSGDFSSAHDTIKFRATHDEVPRQAFAPRDPVGPGLRSTLPRQVLPRDKSCGRTASREGQSTSPVSSCHAVVLRARINQPLTRWLSVLNSVRTLPRDKNSCCSVDMAGMTARREWIASDARRRAGRYATGRRSSSNHKSVAAFNACPAHQVRHGPEPAKLAPGSGSSVKDKPTRGVRRIANGRALSAAKDDQRSIEVGLDK